MSENRKRNVIIGAVAAAVVIVPLAAWLAFGYFEVQALWTDDTVDEELTTFADPGAEAEEAPELDGAGEAPSATVGTAPPAEPVLAATGSFAGVEGHRVAGEANLVENPDGSHLLQFPDLDAENGPDLVLWLSKGGSTDDVIDLGELKGNQGSQEYLIPADVDLEGYDTVLIWCRRFSVGFGEAVLTPV